MERSEMFESIQDARVMVGGGDPEGFENPKSRLAITVRCTDIMTGQPVDVQLWLTIPQFAAIVWEFFSEIVRESNFFSKALRRLMSKRYAVMTSEFARPEPGNNWCIPRYDDPKKIAA